MDRESGKGRGRGEEYERSSKRRRHGLVLLSEIIKLIFG